MGVPENVAELVKESVPELAEVNVLVHVKVNAKTHVPVVAKEAVLALADKRVLVLPDGDNEVAREKNITLVITHQCNLNCIYCYEKHKDNCVMSFECAMDIISRELNANDECDFVEFDFMGGEPFIEFPLIQRIVDAVKRQTWSKSFIFFATTNGTILKDEWKPWLLENRCYFQVSLSLDGTPFMHNINRCNSYSLIDIDFFVNSYPEQTIKMTVSQETLPYLAEGNIFLIEKKINYTCNFAYGIDWSNPKNESMLTEQLSIILDYYSKNPSLVPKGILDPERIISVSTEETGTFRVCGAGVDSKAFDYDGTDYPCQYFLPLSVGPEKAKKAKNIIIPNKNVSESSYSCKQCILRNVCFICFGANYANTGSIYTIDKNMCKLFKIQFKAIALLVSKMFENGNLIEEYEQSAKWIVKSAIMINDML